MLGSAELSTAAKFVTWAWHQEPTFSCARDDYPILDYIEKHLLVHVTFLNFVPQPNKYFPIIYVEPSMHGGAKYS